MVPFISVFDLSEVSVGQHFIGNWGYAPWSSFINFVARFKHNRRPRLLGNSNLKVNAPEGYKT
jgi:hypothetical protein